MPVPSDLDATWRAVDGVEGWMTYDQARRLHERATRLRAGDQVV